ncbi:hypothetical protein Are01nite_34460 [Actinoplanes regularis]|nr:hypothetical protein Are01nite_34460 [Actinoplanes regularis]
MRARSLADPFERGLEAVCSGPAKAHAYDVHTARIPLPPGSKPQGSAEFGGHSHQALEDPGTGRPQAVVLVVGRPTGSKTNSPHPATQTANPYKKTTTSAKG